VARFPDAPQAEQARSRIAALAPPPAPPKPATKAAAKTAARTPAATVAKGDYQVQLGAFSALDKAQGEKTRLEKSFSSTLGGALTVQKPSGGDSLYRLRSAGMTESAARAACQKLKTAGQECMVVRR
jgi:cell division protein FtsN